MEFPFKKETLLFKTYIFFLISLDFDVVEKTEIPRVALNTLCPVSSDSLSSIFK